MGEQKFKVHPDVVDCELGGDRALLHLGYNTYFTVNQTASTLWVALAEPKSLSELVDVVTDKFDVEPDLCRRDIQALLDQMKAAEIVEILSGQEPG